MTAATPPWRREAQPPVSELIQDYLISQGHRPGDQLPTEAQFAAELQVSRNAIREALRALEALGIVTVRHGSGTYLRDDASTGLTTALTFWSRLQFQDDIDTLRLIAEVRGAMETSLVTKVIGQLSEDEFGELEDQVADMEARAANGESAPEADHRFHQVLYRPLNNWVLDHVLTAFWDTHDRVSTRDLPHPDVVEVARQHRTILTALRAGDTAALTAQMARHFDNHLNR